MRKKKFKFDVKLCIQELNSIPLLNGVLFCKARLLGGGDFSGLTPRGNVVSHCVKWPTHFGFSSKLSASPSTGILETCLCRISVRKEVKGGKSHEKLGYVDINLAEYAGSGSVTRRYILEGYGDTLRQRQDNSILKITASMTLTSGDPLFKPQVSSHDQLLAGSVESSQIPTDSQGSAGTYPTARSSIIIESEELKRSQSDCITKPGSSSPSFQHSRSSSSGSTKLHATHSRNSSVDKRFSGLQTHSRQSSNISTGDSGCADLDTFHLHSPVLKKSLMRSGEVHKRIDETRVDADDIIDQLINGTDLTYDTSKTDEGIELSLFLENDGVSTMSKIETRRRRELKPIPIEDRFKTL